MSYKITSTPTYLKNLKKFLKKHPDMLKQYIKAINVLTENPYHPALRLHKLTGKMNEYYSVSINMKYRVLIDFVLQDKQIIPIHIGIHDEVYKIKGQK